MVAYLLVVLLLWFAKHTTGRCSLASYSGLETFSVGQPAEAWYGTYAVLTWPDAANCTAEYQMLCVP